MRGVLTPSPASTFTAIMSRRNQFRVVQRGWACLDYPVLIGPRSEMQVELWSCGASQRHVSGVLTGTYSLPAILLGAPKAAHPYTPSQVTLPSLPILVLNPSRLQGWRASAEVKGHGQA